jgi:hypothetical protein
MSTFRSAAVSESSPLDSFPSVSKDTTDTSILAEKGDAGVFTYEAVHGVPLTVTKFEMKQFWDSPTANEKESIKQVDEWIQSKAKERGLQDTQASYQEIVDEILNQIGKSENEKPQNTFERIKIAIQAQKRLAEAQLPPVLNVETLTPEEYKKTRA